MKRIFQLTLVISICFSFVHAQVIDSLPGERDAFVTELIKRFNDTKKTELVDLAQDFENKVKRGEISEDAMKNLIKTSQKMVLMRGKPNPQLYGVLQAYLELNALKLAASDWTKIQNSIDKVMTNSGAGDTKSTLDYLDFVVPLYRENALYFSKAKVWKMSSNSFDLVYENDGPKVKFNAGDIIGHTVGDSMIILQTSGVYDYQTKIWKGTKGKVTWQRAGLPADEVFVNFNAYTIDMNTQEYDVPEATFTYKNYFDRTISGKFIDKMVTTANAETTQFPKFIANRDDVPAQEITPSVFYYGGFTLSGNNVKGSSGDETSELIIYKENSKQKVLSAKTKTITINLPEKISSTSAEVSLFFDNDSIYHPSIDLFYDLPTNTVKLVRGEGSLDQSMFSDSYHKIDFNVDVLTWNLSTDSIYTRTISTSGLKAATFESHEYFSEPKMKSIRGNVSYDPLSILNKYADANLQNYIYAESYAKLISPTMTVQQIKTLLFNLVKEGFITYDEKTGYIEILSKVNHYVLSNAKKKDFDNIFIKSNDNQNNGVINIATKDYELFGVKSVPISVVTSTILFPDSQDITVKKNRDMEFDGLIFTGRMDIFGRDNYFNYDKFELKLDQLDTLILNIPDGDKVDEYGNPKLRPLNSTLENMKALIKINHPLNKSGNSELPQFPMIESLEKSRVYYANEEIRGGTYTKDKFYYEINPFSMDSLMFLNRDNIKFDGTLYSANIFPEIKEPLKVQDDLSLGFELSSPPEGFDVYTGKGKFISDISLNNEGLTGTGIIKYKTTSFESSNILFYPDSLFAVTDTFGIKESKGAYESPWVKSANNRVEWYPYLDSMVAYSSKENPFEMYNDRIKLDGFLEITDNGIHGGGVADWNDAQLISNRFQFKSDELLADTAELKIKSIDGDKVTFNTPNVNAYVDFKENTGYFKSNTNENRTEFNYNEYATTIDEFFWDIDAKKLEFSVPEGNTRGAPFVSLNLKQDTLTFMAQKADYSLETSVIEASGVTEIFIADSRVIPKDGKINVFPHADMEELSGAIIEADAVNKYHTIEDVTIKINGKYDIKASGKYKYIAKNTPEQYINMPKIEVIVSDSSLLDKKKPGPISKIIHGQGVIDKSDNFIAYPNTYFYGTVDMYSSLEDLKVKGYAKVDFKNEYVTTDFFQVDGKIDPDNLGLTVEGAKDPTGRNIRTGIFVSKTGIEPIYTSILNNQIGPADVPLIEANGVLLHNAEKNIYSFGDEDKMESESPMKGNVLEFSPSDNKIIAEGKLDFALQYNAIDDRAGGKVFTNLADNKYEFKATMALPIDIDKTILEKMGYYLLEDNFDLDDIDYDSKDILNQWAELVSDKSLLKIQEEIGTASVFTKPKDLKATLVFTNVDFTYEPIERVYRSKGKIGLSFVGEKGVHKYIDGYLEFGHRMGSDYFNIYLKTTFNDYIYFTFTTTSLEIASSFDDVIGTINAIDGAKRKVKTSEGPFYIYAPTNEYKAKAFLQKMKIIENGGVPPSEPDPIIIPNQEENVPQNNIEENNGSITPPPVIEETAPIPPAVPKEVLDFEEGQKGKKKKGE